jgi:hypothetical protein
MPQGFRVRLTVAEDRPCVSTIVPVLFPITADIFTGFSLTPLVQELLATPEVENEGKTSRVLIKSERLTVLLTVMRRGARIHEQTIPTPAVAVPVLGDVSFERAPASARVSTDGDSLVLMGSGMQHEILAHTDSAFLLVIGALDGNYAAPS